MRDKFLRKGCAETYAFEILSFSILEVTRGMSSQDLGLNITVHFLFIFHKATVSSCWYCLCVQLAVLAAANAALCDIHYECS